MLNYKVRLEKQEFISLVKELQNNYGPQSDMVTWILKYFIDEALFDVLNSAICSVSQKQPFAKVDEAEIEKLANDCYEVYCKTVLGEDVSKLFITELLFYREIFEKDGCLNSSFDRVLNDREIAVAELLGFEHQTNYLPYNEDEDPLGFNKRGDFISSVHKHSN